MEKLNEEQMFIAKEILRLLDGQNVKSTKEILKAVQLSIQVAAE